MNKKLVLQGVMIMKTVFESNDDVVKLSPRLALIIGLNEAIVLYKFNDLARENNQCECFYIEDRLWIRHSVNDIKNLYFPFWSISTIKRVLYSLDEKGLIKIGNFNKGKLDNTNWYSINYDAVESCINSISLEDNKLVQIETTEHYSRLAIELEAVDLHKITTDKLYSASEEELNDLLNELDLSCL